MIPEVARVLAPAATKRSAWRGGTVDSSFTGDDDQHRDLGAEVAQQPAREEDVHLSLLSAGHAEEGALDRGGRGAHDEHVMLAGPHRPRDDLRRALARRREDDEIDGVALGLARDGLVERPDQPPRLARR